MIQVFKHTTAFLLVFMASVPIQAQEASDFFGNCSEKAWGFINVYDDAKSIPAVYCSASGFSERFAAVKKDEKWGYIDANNNVVIDFQFDYARSFKQGRAIVKKGNFYGVINKEGEFVIPPHYYDLISYELENRQYYISRDSTFFQGIIDTTGKETLPHQYTFIIAYESNLGNQRFYENIPFYTTFQAIDTTKGSFYEQFKEDAYQFYPEKGRQDIYDLQFNKLASRNSTSYTDGFQHDQLRRIDNFLKDNAGLAIAEKVNEIESLLSSSESDSSDSISADTTYLKYQAMNHDKIKVHLESLGYTLFTNGEGKTGLKKGNSIIIPAQYTHLELVNGLLTRVPEDDISFLQENYGGIYRDKEEGILDIFYLMVSNNTAIEMSLYNLSGQKILSLQNQKGISKTALSGITRVGFKYVHLVKDSSDQSAYKHGFVNWKGEELLSSVYESIQVTKSGELLVKQEKKAESETEEHFGLYSKTGAEIIPTGVYSNIEAFPQVPHLFLATRSEPYPTAEERKASEQENKTQVILKIKDHTAVPVSTFIASFISRWALDAESGMLSYRKNIASWKK